MQAAGKGPNIPNKNPEKIEQQPKRPDTLLTQNHLEDLFGPVVDIFNSAISMVNQDPNLPLLPRMQQTIAQILDQLAPQSPTVAANREQILANLGADKFPREVAREAFLAGDEATRDAVLVLRSLYAAYRARQDIEGREKDTAKYSTDIQPDLLS